MKQVLLLLTFLPCLTAWSQTLHKSVLPASLRSRQDIGIIRSILYEQQQKANGSAAKTTTQKKRVAGSAYVQGSILRDSFIYVYSNGRGSVHPNSNDYFQDFYATYNNFRQPYIQYDERKEWTRNGGTMVLSSQNKLAYDGSNKVIQQKQKYNTTVEYTYDITYNSQNTPELIKEKGQGFEYDMYVMYDAQGRRASDSTYDVLKSRPQGKRTYQYDVAGNQISFSSYIYDTVSSEMLPSFMSQYGYDNNNRMIYSYSEMANGGVLVPFSVDSFRYTGTNTQYSYIASYYWNASQNIWYPDEVNTFFRNAHSDIDTYYIAAWNASASAYDTVERDVFYYDTDNLLQYTHGFAYQGNGQFSSTPYDKQTVYWETYDPQSIEKISSNNTISLYPNPVRNDLYFKAEAGIKGNVLLVNSAGIPVYQLQSVLLDSHYIDVSKLPAGSYYMYVNNARGQRLYAATLSKL